MNITVYEDEGYKNFLPLAWGRPVWELRCGATTILERIKRKYPGAEISFKGRDYLVARNQKPETSTSVNGRGIPSSGREIVYPWDLMTHLDEDLEEDLKYLGKGIKGKIHPSAVLLGEENMLIEEGVEIEPFAILDARQGPIYIGKNSVIRPHSFLRGPISIGPECRVGGEVNRSIFHGNSNKQHDGFLGHSYVGEWVNVGAGATNSNLKNNYGTIKVFINGKLIDSGEMFVGCFIGDHAKLGIGTLVNTGTVIGFGANVLGGKVTPKVIPDFSWSETEKYRWEDFIETVRVVMERRGKELTEKQRKILEYVYRQTLS